MRKTIALDPLWSKKANCYSPSQPLLFKLSLVRMLI